jgi:hypothetical protein
MERAGECGVELLRHYLARQPFITTLGRKMTSRIGDQIPRKPVVTIWFLGAAGIAIASSLDSIKGDQSWGLPLTMLAVAAVLFILPWWNSGGRETVQVDSNGVRCIVGEGLQEQVRWSDIARVRIATTNGGPSAEDVFFLLEAADGTGCCVTHGAAVRTGLLEALQTHLPSVDDEAVIQAMGSTSNSMFVIWEKDHAHAA